MNNQITKPVYVRTCVWRDFDGSIRETKIFRHEVIWKRGWRHIKGARKIARKRKVTS